MFRALALLLGLVGLTSVASAEEGVEYPFPWDPGAHQWSREAIENTYVRARETAVKSVFLGDVSAMRPYEGVDFAWFATDYDAENYSTVAVAPPTNGMGRYHVTGSEFIRDFLVSRLGAIKPWKKNVTEGTQADLVVYVNIRYYTTTLKSTQYLAELLAVDKHGKVMIRLQDGPGKLSGAGAKMAMAGMSGGASGMAVASIPSEADQWAYLQTAGYKVGNDFHSAIASQRKAKKKGKPYPLGAADEVVDEAATKLDAKAQNFGPELSAQVEAYLAIVQDERAELNERRDRVKDLGKIGALEAVPVFTEIIVDKNYERALRNDMVWALGEIGHPDALSAVEDAPGVGKTKKYAAAKISEY
jgi:hypothetical protein